MAKMSHTDSKRMYSWWWDSHISPKNSKWLQENLTDMDAKVKVMIKLIEEDADSFARRAEMYYKKRPELMRMVEEFYRAYRALAERYDHATGVIRHAHRTMAEAFPNQVPSMFADDSPAFSGTDPRTPDGDAFKQSGEFTDESDTVARRRALKQQLNDPFGSVEKVRKGLNFDETEEKENTRFEKLSKPDEERESEEILKLKEFITKLESEKEAGLVQYQESVDKLSQLELEISQTREDFRVYSDRATKAENKVVILKESLSKLESEKESRLQEYERSLERLSDLEAIISAAQEDTEKSNQRACVAEMEAQSLRVEWDKMAVEKDAALGQYLQSLEAISKLENKLRVTEEDASQLKERAEKAESEIEILKQTISKLTDDKEAAARQYQQCLDTISSLEDKLTRAQDEAKLLNLEIDSGVSKIKGAEEKCLLLERSNQSLHSELESLMLKMGTQTQDLTEKQKELAQLWACLQEERLRFVEAETAFQTLQHLHAQSREELRSMASELQKRAQLLDISQTHNQSLQDEVLKVKEENKHLDELNASSSSSIKEMQIEISDLKDSKGKLEEEVELRLDERNALQQEIYCLKEELNDLQKKHHSVVDQVYMVGLSPESFGPSVRELQDENSNLKETWDRERKDKEALMAKLEIMEHLLEKNAVLETSISDLNAELDAVRGKIETLEQSLQSLLKEKSYLLDEKASLMTQLQEANKNLESLAEKNTVMANSLSDAHNQLQMLLVKAKTFEDSCQLLENEKADLIGEKHGLNSQLENTLKRLEELGKHHGELEGRYTALEKERDSTLRKVQELQTSLEVARQEHGNYMQISELRLIGVDAEIRNLHEECQWRKREFDEVIDNAMIFEIETFVLQRTAQELKLNNFSLMKRNEQLLEKSTLFEKIMLQLEKSKVEQQVEIKALSDQASSLRAGTCQLLKVLNIVNDPALMDKAEQHHFYFNDQLFSAIQDLKTSLCKAEEENQQWAVELSVLVEWIRQLRHEVQNLDVEKSNIEHDFKERSEQLSSVQIEVFKHLETNENLRLKLKEGDCIKEALMIHIEDLQRNIMDMQGTCETLQREKSEVYEEKRTLMEKFLHLEEKNNVLEEENCVLCDKVLALDDHSLVLRSCAEEKLIALRELGEDRNKLHDVNGVLMGKLSSAEGRLEESNIKILHLQQQLQRSENELKVIATVKDQLSDDIENGKNVLHQMKLELQEAEQKMNIVEKKKFELHKIVEDLEFESNEFKIIRDDQENQIFNLSATNDQLSVENNRLREASQILEGKLHDLHEELDKSQNNGEDLKNELKMKGEEIDELEIQATSAFGQLQYSMVCQLLFKQKFHELEGACLDYIDQNEGLKNQLAAFRPEIVSLKACVASLEDHTERQIKLQNPEDEELQGAEVISDLQGIDFNEDEEAPMQDMFSDLRDLHARLQAYEKASAATREAMVQESIDLHSKLDTSLRQIEFLKSESWRYRRSLKQTSEISEAENTLLMKDIMLDQISNGSPYGVSSREPIDTDNQIVELPENIDPIKSHKGGFLDSDEPIVKESSMDELEISKRFAGPVQEENKKKVLERLDSDVQKLTNLQITVQDLKRKLHVTEKGKRGKSVVECEALKGKLEEADIAIIKLIDFNGRLNKTVEHSTFSDVKSSFDLEGDGNARRRVSEQARRMSEKIGRLQLEVQKLQFILLKLGDEKEAKPNISDIKRRVLLRDYLYGGRRTGQGRTKAPFFRCFEPSTVDR